MPYGLRNSGQTFQRFMDQVLRGLPFVFCYIDDLLISSSSLEEHLSHLRQVFSRLQEYGIVLNTFKCLFGVPQLSFLGHHVSSAGISPLEDKVSVMRNFSRPTSRKQLRSFCGMVNFYHRFIRKWCPDPGGGALALG